MGNYVTWLRRKLIAWVPPSLHVFEMRQLGADGPYLPAWKRIADVGIAICALAFAAPIIAGASLLVTLDGGRPFLGQSRLGLGGRQFRAYKIRTMIVGAEQKLDAILEADPDAREEFARTAKLRNDPRITAVGRVLRRFSIDELPQLLNVIKGDMSIVGPRPRTLRELTFPEAEDPLFGVYYRVRPGLTGPWQVSGRSSISYGERIKLDADYVAAVTPVTDVKLILRTILVVVFDKEAY